MTDSTHRPRWRWLLLGAIAFGLAHTQALDWYSNQHQYMLHGLAKNSPTLRPDWLANTIDPTPLFSGGVALVDPLPRAAFHVVYFGLLGVYFLALMRFAAVLPFAPPPLAFAALLIAAHAAIARLASVSLVGVDFPWFLQAGVAGQYVLGPAIQPSAFGVWLVVAVAAFAYDRLAWAVGGIAVACALHATNLLPAALLTLGFQVALIRARRVRAAVGFGVAALVAVAPVVVWSTTTFAATSPKLSETAVSLLVNVRIPHHCVVGRWLDWVAGVQLAWVALALVLVRRSRLFTVLSVPAILGVALTLVQAVTGNELLALAFPWRVSVVLVPLATAIVFARVADWLRAVPSIVSVAVIVALAASGVWVMSTGEGYRTIDDELPLLEFARDSDGADVYLLPVKFPPVGGGKRGVFSASFTPPPRPDLTSNQIPVDLQRFRLFAGRPIYVDFKAVPYKDVEVLEWHRRMTQCEAWYATTRWGADVRDELRREGVTRVVSPSHRPLSGDALDEVYADPHYRVYRVR